MPNYSVTRSLSTVAQCEEFCVFVVIIIQDMHVVQKAALLSCCSEALVRGHGHGFNGEDEVAAAAPPQDIGDGQSGPLAPEGCERLGII